MKDCCKKEKSSKCRVPQGFPGVTGPQGFPGAAGPVGPQGIQGVAGPTGVAAPNVSLFQSAPTAFSALPQTGTLTSYNLALPTQYNTGTNIFTNGNGTWQINTTGYYRFSAQVTFQTSVAATSDFVLSIWSVGLAQQIGRATLSQGVITAAFTASATSFLTIEAQSLTHLLVAGDLISIAITGTVTGGGQLTIGQITTANNFALPSSSVGTSFSGQLYGF